MYNKIIINIIIPFHLIMTCIIIIMYTRLLAVVETPVNETRFKHVRFN